jgi:hypothetical protein
MLTTKTVEVGGITLVLCETTLRTDHIRAEKLKQAGAEPDGGELDNLARWIYPSLVACVLEGTPPSREELVDLPVRELTAWRETAQRLNPAWFAAPADHAEDDAGQEKKES